MPHAKSALRGFLIPFYFSPTLESVRHDSVQRQMFGRPIAGIPATDFWRRHAGISFRLNGVKSHGGGALTTQSALWTSKCRYPRGHRYRALCLNVKYYKLECEVLERARQMLHSKITSTYMYVHNGLRSSPSISLCLIRPTTVATSYLLKLTGVIMQAVLMRAVLEIRQYLVKETLLSTHHV